MSSKFTRLSDVARDENPEQALSLQIIAHDDANKGQSVLHSWLSKVWDGGAAAAGRDLEKAKKDLDSSGDQRQAGIQALAAVDKDREALASRDKYLGYASGAVQTTALALSIGRFHRTGGLLTSAAVGALDTMKEGSTGSQLLTEGTLGSVKGLALLAMYKHVSTNSWNPFKQGAVVLGTGVAARTADVAADPSTYKDGIANGLTSVLSRSINTQTLDVDFATAVAAGFILHRANVASGGALDRSPAIRGMATGAVFGTSLGTSAEIVRQQNSNEPRSLSKIFENGLVQGAIGVIPGALSSPRPFRETQLKVNETPLKTSGMPLKAPETEALSTPISAVSPQREFKIVSGSLDEFFQARESGSSTRNSAMLKVRELSADRDQGLKPTSDLWVRHVKSASEVKTGEVTACGRTTAVCFGEALDPRVREKLHILPKVDGPIRLHASEDLKQIAFTGGDVAALEGYPRSTLLGSPAMRMGHRSQDALYQWLKTPLDVDPRVSTMSNVMRKKLELQDAAASGPWKSAQTENNSAADRIGMDILLVNPNSGGIITRDTTQNNKGGFSEMRNEMIFRVNLDRMAARRTGADFVIAEETYIRFADNLIAAMQKPTLLSTRDTLIPNYRRVNSEEAVAADIAAFKDRLKVKQDLLSREARDIDYKQPARAKELRENSAKLRDYRDDVELAERYMQQQARAAADPARPANEARFRQNVEQEIKIVARAMKGSGNVRPNSELRGRRDGSMSYNQTYDTLTLMHNGQRYQFTNIKMQFAQQMLKDGVNDHRMLDQYIDKFRERLDYINPGTMITGREQQPPTSNRDVRSDQRYRDRYR